MRRVGDFAVVLGDERGGGEGEGALLLVGANPVGCQQVGEQGAVGGGQRLEVEVRCPAGKAGVAVGCDADELQPLGEDGAVAGLDLVGEQEEQRGFRALVGGVHEDRALAQQIGVLLQHHVADGEHERMAGVDHLRRRAHAGPVERADGFLGEADALVALQDGLVLAAVAAGEPAVALADRRRGRG